MNKKTADKGRIDWMITIVPFVLIMGLAVYLFVFPEQANGVISQVRFFFGDTLGSYYLVIGLGILIISVFLSFSKYGNIVLGEQNEKPKFDFFTWGSMMFTCGLAADILFYSFAEWVMYATNPHIAEMGGGHHRMGWSLPALPLEFYTLGFLSRARCCFRFYAPLP